MKIQAIILAGGAGDRFGGETAKQFIKIAGKTILEHTTDVLEKSPYITSIIIVVNNAYYEYTNELIIRQNFKKVSKILKGGLNRNESSSIGIDACDNDTEYVLFHDAVRPFLSHRIIYDVVEALKKYDAVDVAIPSADTIIRVNDSQIIENIPLRKYLMRGQTPQAFKLETIKKAYKLYKQNPIQVSDDCSLITNYNLTPVFVVQGEEKNIKITYSEDIYLADKLFQQNQTQLMENDIVDISRIKNKTIVVFGHSSGIGKCIYELGSSHGAHMFGFSKSEGVDVADSDVVESVLQDVFNRQGNIDYVINTAGSLMIKKLCTLSHDEIMEQIKTNYIGSINITKAAIPYLEKTKGGILLFTSSSYTRGRAMYSIYSSTKAAIVNFMQAIAEELYGDCICINVANPERTKTKMRIENFGIEPDNSLLSPEKVAQYSLAIILSGITGQVIDIRK